MIAVQPTGSRQEMWLRGLGPEVTLLDVIKSLAVIIMICDHIGAYFFDQIEWFRAIGRIGLPVWFFLAGYSRSQRIPRPLWMGTIILIGVDLVTCQPILPLNALVGILCIRLVMDKIDRYVLGKFEIMAAVIILLLLSLLLPVYPFEYGAEAILLAISGHLARKNPGRHWFYHLFCLSIVLGCETIDFEFSWPAEILMVVGLGTMFAILLHLHRLPRVVSVRPNGVVAAMMRLGGRYTLEIYVLHITIFCVLAFFLYPDARACFQLMPVY